MKSDKNSEPLRCKKLHTEVWETFA
jgi:hypothetical protein